MNTSTVQRRQLVYALGIVTLFAAMFPYGQWLERVKTEKDLGEATIGQVDTGSFMLKLAMIGGARGIAANVLWNRAVHLQRVQEWDKLKSTVDLITKLQPHFLAIWTFQGWNLAYNVSVEWDDPADKYLWIKKGIQFLQDGVKKNENSPDLHWDTAWTYYHKYGFSDEAILLRREFYDDPEDDFKRDPLRPAYPMKDNFQVARGWFELAIDKAERYQRLATDMEANVETVDPVQNRKGRPGDLAFRSMPAHAQTRYAAGLEKQSIRGIRPQFGEISREAWSQAEGEWLRFGGVPFESHNAIRVQGKLASQPIRIGDVYSMDAFEKMTKEQWLAEINNPAGTTLKNERTDDLTPAEMKELAKNKQYWTDRWASQVNFRFWVDRARAEKTPEGTEARRLFYEGTVAYRQADFLTAIDNYKKGLAVWKELLERFPTYRDDELNQLDTGQVVRRYASALKQAGEPVGDDLPFYDLMKAAEEADAPDPFDELDMLGPIGTGKQQN